MRTLKAFNSISVDGYFCDASGDMSWAHQQDPEWNEFSAQNASGGSELVFGRVTYDMMRSYWPTQEARDTMPIVADKMNSSQKIVFSRTLDDADWENTELIGDDIAAAVARKKQDAGDDMVIMGSGTIVSQLTEARLIDEYQLVVNPRVLGSGRTLFEGLDKPMPLRVTDSRAFGNGNVVIWYEPAE